MHDFDTDDPFWAEPTRDELLAQFREAQANAADGARSTDERRIWDDLAYSLRRSIERMGRIPARAA